MRPSARPATPTGPASPQTPQATAAAARFRIRSPPPLSTLSRRPWPAHMTSEEADTENPEAAVAASLKTCPVARAPEVLGIWRVFRTEVESHTLGNLDSLGR